MRTPKIMFAATLLAATAVADDNALDVTIRVIESPNDLPSAVTKTIQLPPSAFDRGRERPQQGIERANEARAQARDTARNIAEQAKERSQGKRGGKAKP
ncbi:MAG: hypothetical protein ACJ8J7_06815 [Sulfurifustaceae bacterium]